MRCAGTALGSCEEVEVRKGTVGLVSTHMRRRRRGGIDGIRNLHGTSREGSEMLLGRQNSVKAGAPEGVFRR